MEELSKHLVELSNRIGPGAVDAARVAAQVESLHSLVYAAVFLILGLGGLLWAWRMWQTGEAIEPQIKALREADRYDNDGKKKLESKQLGLAFGSMVAAALSTLCVLICTASLINPWNYVAFKNPDAWLAAKVLKIR